MIFIKMLYLVTGALVAQTIIQANSLVKKYIEDQEKKRDKTQEYRPVKAIRAGSAEAISLEARLKHEHAVRPQVLKITKKIQRAKMIPFIACLIATFLAVAIVAVFEEDESRTKAVPAAIDPTEAEALLQENLNLRDQVEVLEQMVKTLNAEIEEIHAVMDRPPSS